MDENKLSKQDVISLSKSANIENKSNIARKVSNYYNNTFLSPQEAKLAEDIFRIMIRDTEIKIREVLADHLKNCKNIPQDIVEAIINDNDSVAVPFLQYYKSLTSEDLIKILEMPGINKHKAIAQRPNLSAQVSQYIAKHCSDQIVGELVSNESADIQENTFEIITNKYAENEDIKKRLVYRSELPAAVIEKIIDKLSYQLKTHLMLHHNLNKDIASNLVEDIKEKLTLGISEEYSNDRQIEELVHQLYKANKLTPGLVVRAICLGDLKFFEYAIVYLSETPIAEVRKILFNNKTDFMIRNLLRKAFIPKSVFPAIFSALKIINEIRFDCGRTNRKAFGHKVIERILTLTQNTNELTSEDINYLVSKIN